MPIKISLWRNTNKFVKDKFWLSLDNLFNKGKKDNLKLNYSSKKVLSKDYVDKLKNSRFLKLSSKN
jgi:hypothetical protein